MKAVSDRLRLSVFRSIQTYLRPSNRRHQRHDLGSRLEQSLNAKGSKTELSVMVGKAIAEAASAKGVKTVVFDRGEYKYHGRVKALADAAREGWP